jgi:hypothetical protein
MGAPLFILNNGAPYKNDNIFSIPVNCDIS